MAQVEWNMTPQDFSLAGLWKDLPIYGFFAFAFSFLGVCLAIGIFRCACMFGDRTMALLVQHRSTLRQPAVSANKQS